MLFKKYMTDLFVLCRGTTGGGVNGGTMVMMPGGDGRTFPGQGRGVGGDQGSGTGGNFPGDGRGRNPGAPFWIIDLMSIQTEKWL